MPDTTAKAFIAIYAATVLFFGWIFMGKGAQPQDGFAAGGDVVFTRLPPAGPVVEIHTAHAVITEPKP